MPTLIARTQIKKETEAKLQKELAAREAELAEVLS